MTNERRRSNVCGPSGASKFHAAIYLVVNALIVVVWASSGAGYFWPIWAMLGWGIGLAFHGWSVYLQKRISEDEIRREMERDR